jgi:cytochrome P450
MIPFGAGRRACPGIELSLLHLEYLVARLVATFEWRAAVDGEQVDFAERLELSIVMRRALRARVVPCN